MFGDKLPCPMPYLAARSRLTATNNSLHQLQITLIISSGEDQQANRTIWLENDIICNDVTYKQKQIKLQQ